jgi:hypothetical protein
MRMIFGVMAVLVVLAIVGTLGKKQLEALGMSGQNAARTVQQSVPGAMPAPAAEATLPAQSRAIQHSVRDAAAAALQQGADRSAQEPKP